MKAVLIRTGSLPVQSPNLPGSPRISLPVHDSAAAAIYLPASPKTNSLHLHTSRRRRIIPRASSDSDLIWSETDVSGRSGGVGSSSSRERGFGRSSYAGDGGDDCGMGILTGENVDRSETGAYYREMLKKNPGDPLLLRNYGKFLHEVEKDTVKAEEYYGRSLLANPEDGEVLSLYGNLIWETERDEERAKSYLDRSVEASPNDCTVLGSYAHFMWEQAEEEEEDEVETTQSMVAPF